MIVHHFNTVVHGGAATAARRLHDALRTSGVDSRFWCSRLDATTSTDASYKLVPWGQLACWNPPASSSLGARQRGSIWRRLAAPWGRVLRKWRLKRALAGRPEGLDLFSLPRLPLATPLDPRALADGIVHLHWIANLIDYPSFFASLPDHQPIVWTLHDMFPFTGGCHYAGSCDAFLTECKNCPQLGRSGDKDLANLSFHVKRRALRGKNLHIVTPSHWLTREAKRSRLLANARSVQTIHYPLDTAVFRPRDKQEARRAWRLADEDVVVLFGADSLSVRRKGMRELLDALGQLTDKQRVLLVVFGGGRHASCDQAAIDSREGLPRIRHVGFLDDPHRQALLYSAADMLVLPSLEDNSPQTGLEALACGTPVVGFAAGGIPDYVRPQQTGLLAQVGNAHDLARQINWLVHHPQDGRRMGHNGRVVVEREFSHEATTQKYVDLYRRLLEDVPQETRRSAARRRSAA